MELRRKTLKLMGSHIDILIFDSIDAESILDDAVEMLKMYEHRFSANDDSSELMEVNHNAGIKAVKVHPDLFDLIKIGKLHSFNTCIMIYNHKFRTIIVCTKSMLIHL